MAGPTVFVNQRIHFTQNTIFLEPLNSDGIPLVHEEIIKIDRYTYEITLEPNNGQIPVIARCKEVVGLIGMTRILKGRPYLIVATSKEKVGTVSDGEIWKVKDTEMILVSSSELEGLSPREAAINKKYTAMLQQVLSTPDFYFSYNSDITHTKQRLNGLEGVAHFKEKSFLSRCEKEYVWNYHMLEDFLGNKKLHKYVVILVHGFASVNACEINGCKITLAIVARRSTGRVGTRSNRRGLDAEGNAAQFVETEQIVEMGTENLASYIINRGSLAVLWDQFATMAMKPDPTIATTGQEQAFKNHIRKQVGKYGKQVIVNLVSKKGSEAPLANKLQEIVSAVRDKDVFYEQVDISDECGKIGWKEAYDNLVQKLDDTYGKGSTAMGYYLRYPKRKLRNSEPQVQNGVYRVNCLDSTDRTNAAQSFLARKNLQVVLLQLGVIKDSYQPLPEEIEILFREVWCNHGDVIAMQYCGTGALYADFTRTHKRTKRGAAEDWRRLMVRYYKNNFTDGFRQDSLDLFVGNYVIPAGEGVTSESPLFTDHLGKRYFALPLLLIFSLAMLLLTLFQIIPGGLEASLFWSVMIFGLGGTMIYHGPALVDLPLLVKKQVNV